MPVVDPVVAELRLITKFDDYVTAGRANGNRWIGNVLGALRHNSCRVALKLPPDASDGELLQGLAKCRDKQRLLKKGGCDLESAIQAETFLHQLLNSKPRTAWEREAKMPTGKLDRLRGRSVAFRTRRFVANYGFLVAGGFFFLLALAMLGAAGWMRLNGYYLDFLDRHWWAWPHGFCCAAGLFVIGLCLAAIHFFSKVSCCRRSCWRCSRCFCRCCFRHDDSCCLSGSCGKQCLRRLCCFCCMDRRSLRCFCCRRRLPEPSEEPPLSPLSERSLKSSELAGSPSALKRSSTRSSSSTGSRFSFLGRGKALDDSDNYDEDLEGLDDVPDLPLPDMDTLAFVMMSPKCFPYIDDNFTHHSEAETTMMPRSTSSLGKSVTFPYEGEGSHEPVTVVASVAESPTSSPSAQRAGSSITALWHDPSYSFAARFAREAAKQAAEDARDPSMIASMPVHASGEQRKGAVKHLQELVCDQPVEGVEYELRPHMVQFWQDTMYESEPKYPRYHPHSKRSLEEQKQLHKCATNKKKLKLIKPLFPPKKMELPPSSPEAMQHAGDVYKGQSPTSLTDAAGLMASSRFGLESPFTSDRLVGLTHPKEFGPMDDAAQYEAYGGSQTLPGWSSPASSRYAVPTQINKSERGEEDDLAGLDARSDKSPSVSPSPRSPSSPSTRRSQNSVARLP